MNENNANFTPAAPNFKTLVRMSFQGLTNFPYIEEDFDALTNYGLLSKVVEYLNTVISNNNEQNTVITNLYNAYISIQDYVNDYFDNLDVQEEINNKLDDLVKDGTLTNLISAYIQPRIDEQNLRINNIENQVQSIASGSPAGVYDTLQDLINDNPDHSKIYLTSNNGHWNYFNGTTFVSGGVYQSMLIGDKTIIPEQTTFLNHETNNMFDNRFILNGFYNQNGVYQPSDQFWSTDKINVVAGKQYRSNITGFICFFDSNNEFISSTQNSLNTNGVFETPENTAYLYGSFAKRYINTIYIIPAEDESYYNYYTIQDNITTSYNNTGLKSVGFENTRFFEFKYKDKTNMINNLTNLTGYTLNNDGTLNQSATYTVCDYVTVDEHVRYAINNSGARICFYDKNKMFLSEILQVQQTSRFEFETPAQTKYIRAVISNGRLPFKMCLATLSFDEIGEYSAYIDIETTLKNTIKNLYDENIKSNNKMNCLGDSITYGLNATNSYVTYLTNYGLITRNYGKSASTISKQQNKTDSFIERYSAMSDDADIISVMGGTNDFALNVPLGTPSSTNQYEFYGALKYLINGLIEKYPNKKIMFITELHRSYNVNTIGVSYDDYLSAIKYVCNLYSIPILNLTDNMGYSVNNDEQVTLYIPDRLHPNDNGQKIIANKIFKFIKYTL